ncbi:MAG: valine--tRNA ligase, partial [Defluviitaleaceae bacterium]|nr:valine--tRNA ligase [Defluviitaleaceae bacterium]
MKKELEKNYNPAFENEIYERWMEKNYYHAEVDQSRKPFTIVMPPPNITGELHMGHALNNTIQDILIRFKRMQGYNALWLPGQDHASIATEAKLVSAMAQEGLTKADIGREKYLERAWAWKDKYGGTIARQLRKMGVSCDWARERFTLDEGLNKAVLTVFMKLYDKGWIYRGERLVNWCPKCKTSVSDAEVEHEDADGLFYHFRYPIDGTGEFISFATTRPETMLGDTAVAVNPKDERYTRLVGKTVTVPVVNRQIPIIADEYVDIDFGTGVVKITPGHDPNDYEVGERHGLPVISILNDDGTLNANAGYFEGLDRYDARKKITEEFKELGLYDKTEKIRHNLGTHDRCHSVLEPMVKTQWFVKMKEMAQPAIDVYKSGELKIVPERFGKVYLHWLENIRDWCISRQLWWGHRIPAYYCQGCGEITVAMSAPEKCGACGCREFKQDEDVLDTWFSSALWPFSTLGWPE